MEIRPDPESPEGNIDYPDVPDLSFNFEPTENPSELQDDKTDSYRDKLTENYENSEFPELVADLKAEIRQHKRPKDHPDFIGEGYSSAVFMVRTNEGEKYAVRIPEFCTYNAVHDNHCLDIEHYVKPFSLGEELEGLEQPAAASIEDNVLISPFVEGTTLEEITDEDYLKITPQHIQKFIDNVSVATDKGILIDDGLDNFILTENDGIFCIDYLENDDTNYAENKIESLAAVFRSMLRQKNFDNLRDGRTEVYSTLEAGINNSILDDSQKRRLHGQINSIKTWRGF
jgi:hypothetical protein